MKDRLINWELVNLFPDDEDIDDEDDDMLEEEDDEDDEDYLSKEKKDMSPTIHINGPKLRKMVHGPLGTFILDDSFHPMRGLETYMAHINFPITPRILQTLDKLEGIEVLKQLGRYRLLFIFGSMFDVEDVIDKVEEILDITTSKEDDTNEDKSNMLNQVFEDEVKPKLESDFWIAYIYPNGRYEYENLDNKEDVEECYKQYLTIKEVSDGTIFKYNEEKCEQLQSNDEQ